VVSNLERSLKFYIGLFGMQKMDFEDGALVFLTTPGRGDLLALNPGGKWGYPGGCAKENPREEGLAGICPEFESAPSGSRQSIQSATPSA
jgi:catechol 2,3-dioxygenase-like lactoylglutathione lyase family enzyme